MSLVSLVVAARRRRGAVSFNGDKVRGVHVEISLETSQLTAHLFSFFSLLAEFSSVRPSQHHDSSERRGKMEEIEMKIEMKMERT